MKLLNELYCGSYNDWLSTADKRSVDMIFADPFDNIGLDYNGFKDKIAIQEYEAMIMRILLDGSQVADCIWLSMNAKHTTLLGYVSHLFLRGCDWELKTCVQTFTFGQHNKRDLGNNHRLLYRYTRPGKKLYPDRIRIPSWRLLNGDKRANKKGRVPGDVFDFPRVTGNSKQRRSFSPTQLHEGLYERCINLCVPKGGIVVDLFAGSGTLGRVHERCDVNSFMIEISRETCNKILEDQPTCVEVLL